ALSKDISVPLHVALLTRTGPKYSHGLSLYPAQPALGVVQQRGPRPSSVSALLVSVRFPVQESGSSMVSSASSEENGVQVPAL
ncbi:hypothetical protein P7K49_012446, partial [Saguinus oedipus]